MSLLQEIADWSKSQPLWQQDALRRIFENTTLSDGDLDELVLLCKKEHGLDDSSTSDIEAIPLGDPDESDSLPEDDVRLLSISPISGVNAIKDGEHLSFNDNLTVIYGRNGTGKSGFARVLKQVCRTRSYSTSVLPNVYSETSQRPSAEINYLVGSEDKHFVWQEGEETPSELSSVSVFDSKAASVYVRESGEIAYLPNGLDLLSRLSATCDIVKSRLQTEKIDCEVETTWLDEFPEKSKIRELLSSPIDESVLEDLKSLSTLTEDEVKKLELAKESLAKHDAIPKLLKQVKLQVNRASSIKTKLESAIKQTSSPSASRLQSAHRDFKNKTRAYDLARTKAFQNSPLQGVGDSEWKELWEAARKYSTGLSLGQDFPPREGDLCVLCQQEIPHDHAQRLSSFEDFLTAELNANLKTASDELDRLKKDISSIDADSIASDADLDEIELFRPGLKDVITESIELIRSNQESLLSSRYSDFSPQKTQVIQQLESLLTSLDEQRASFAESMTEQGLQNLNDTVETLEAREHLAKNFDGYVKQARNKQVGVILGESMKSCGTLPITLEHGRIIKQDVFSKLQERFNQELHALKVDNLPIELRSSGTKGKALQRLAFSPSVSNVEAEDVLSEGEQRCVALAAFLAETSLQDSRATVVFDDPVSSLDHDKRSYVASRIVETARQRPVVVFTHDIVFLIKLQDLSDKPPSIDVERRMVERLKDSTGVIYEDLPWDGKKVKQRLGDIRVQHSSIKKLFETDKSQYTDAVYRLYGQMRKTWERGVEELLLQGAIGRFQYEVKTSSLKKLHLISESHIDTLHEGMTKCSIWEGGHDHAPELSDPIPEPDEILDDIEMLNDWSNEVRKLLS